MGEKLPSGTIPTLPAVITTVEDIGRVAKAVRKSQDLTQLDVAGLSSLGNRFVVEMEKGKPTIQMQKVLEVLNLLGLELVVKKKGQQ